MESPTDDKNSLICYEELLWLAYKQGRGEIERYYFSSDQKAAVVLIGPHKHRPHKDISHRHRLHKHKSHKEKTMDLDLFYPIEELGRLTPDMESCLWTCISQFHRIAQLDLDIKRRDEVFIELYLIVVYLFVVLESQPAHRWGLARDWTRPGPGQEPPDAADVHASDISPTPRRVDAIAIKATEQSKEADSRIRKALDLANSHLRELDETIGQFASREAQGIYIRAMLPGSLFVLVPVAIYTGIIFGLGASHRWATETRVAWYLVAIAATTGALGAAVSVMFRVANQPLKIDYHAGCQLIWMNGSFRPIVGAVFGLVFYIIINAGLLQVLTAPREIGDRAFLIAAISFVAGFSERRAQDVILRAVPIGKGAEAQADTTARRPEEGRVS
jgi:hypothetical protein